MTTTSIIATAATAGLAFLGAGLSSAAALVSANSAAVTISPHIQPLDTAVTGDGDLTKTLVDGSNCLDGTLAGYYHRASSNSSSTLWVFFLQGGGACFDEASCTARAKTHLGTSKGWAESEQPSHPVLSSNVTENPVFADANVVFVPYCTGDVHAGQRANASAATWGLYFSGHRNLDAIVSHLKQVRGRWNDCARGVSQWS